MSQEWMIDVLSDLKAFAQQNGLMGLAEHLDDTILVAAAELNSGSPHLVAAGQYAKQDRVISGAFERSDEL
ncbi:MAG: hypothetical protein ACE5DK_01850 [Paracoccaceae bacterium]